MIETKTEFLAPFTPEETASIEAYLHANLDREIHESKGAFGWPLDVVINILFNYLERPTYSREEAFWVWQCIRRHAIERYGTSHFYQPRRT